MWVDVLPLSVCCGVWVLVARALLVFAPYRSRAINESVSLVCKQSAEQVDQLCSHG